LWGELEKISLPPSGCPIQNRYSACKGRKKGIACYAFVVMKGEKEGGGKLVSNWEKGENDFTAFLRARKGDGNETNISIMVKKERGFSPDH